MTQTLSITFHLTRVDDSVDTADNAETQLCSTSVGLAVSMSVKHQVEVAALSSARDVRR